MLRDFIWKTFENTGNIDNYIFFRELNERRQSYRDKKKTMEEVATGSGKEL